MAFERFLNHANALVLKYAMPFWGKPKWAALGAGIGFEIQELENAIFDVIESRWLVNATGPRLRTLAKIVGQPTLAYDDTTLRKLISVRIRVNRSEGRWDDLVRIVLLWGVASFELSNAFPAGLRLELQDTATDSALLAQTIKPAVAAGVRLTILAPPLGVAAANTLACMNVGGTSDPARADGDTVAGGIGGSLSNIYG